MSREDTVADKKIITVFGSSTAQPDTQLYQDARTLGRLLAEAGFTVMNGGYFGTMEAVSRGAKEAGGRVIGITLSLFDQVRPFANRWLDEEIKKKAYLHRLEHLIVQSDGCIGLEGSIGTLSEVFVTWSLLQVKGMNPKPLILMGDRWRRVLRALVQESFVPEDELRTIHVCLTPEETVQVLTEKVSQQKKGI